jgi:hypothetical protein
MDDISEYLYREVRGFMEPIEAAGYTMLCSDKPQRSLEGQLRSYLFGVHEEEQRDRIFRILEGEEPTSHCFSIQLKIKFRETELEFLFKGKIDENWGSAALILGMEVKIGSYTAYYPYQPSRDFPRLIEVFNAFKKAQPRSMKGSRIVKKRNDKGNRL